MPAQLDLARRPAVAPSKVVHEGNKLKFPVGINI